LPFSLDDLLCGVFWFLRKNSLYTKVVRFSFNQRTEDRDSTVGAAFPVLPVPGVVPGSSSKGSRDLAD
ncbi:MAG: hypothetical protein WBG51_19435, partial [Syntrophobacteria bacterium]